MPPRSKRNRSGQRASQPRDRDVLPAASVDRAARATMDSVMPERRRSERRGNWSEPTETQADA